MFSLNRLFISSRPIFSRTSSFFFSSMADNDDGGIDYTSKVAHSLVLWLKFSSCFSFFLFSSFSSRHRVKWGWSSFIWDVSRLPTEWVWTLCWWMGWEENISCWNFEVILWFWSYDFVWDNMWYYYWPKICRKAAQLGLGGMYISPEQGFIEREDKRDHFSFLNLLSHLTIPSHLF